ncbi:hypothetical protein L9F63_025784 [Diploptera punctata]|uniref:AB hydrolase-1 domain-containing protein n=1 Tax=Diploptera punctata TaxID=6984 RepID=A0AAD8E3I9_DIPPU|nr:hypothetical protein L9F63_025784 [Diploptera punctata]
MFWRVKPRPTAPECLTDPVYGIHGYLPIEGVKIHYVEKGDRSKPLMLFIHGFPEFWYSWRHQIKEFSKDYWTVAVDMRGYGDSEKPEESLGRETCTLVAHDYGGAVAWNFIMTHPEMLDSYVILDAPYSPSNLRVMTTNFLQFIRSWDVYFFQLPYLPEFMFIAYDMEDIQAYKYTFGKPGAFTPPINYFRANGFSISPSKLSLKTDVPVSGLYMFGEHDDHYVFDHLRTAQTYIKNLQVKMIKGASHFAQQDDPEKVNLFIREFLRTKKPATAPPPAPIPVETLAS